MTRVLACVASVPVWFRSKERPVLAAREMKREPKNERGGRGRGRFPSFLPHPLPTRLRAPFFAQSLTLVPRSLLLNLTETLATQANRTLICHSAVNDIASFLISIACTIFTLKFFMLSELSQSHRTFERQCTSLL